MSSQASHPNSLFSVVDNTLEAWVVFAVFKEFSLDIGGGPLFVFVTFFLACYAGQTTQIAMPLVSTDH
jgi:hypothetical protein